MNKQGNPFKRAKAAPKMPPERKRELKHRHRTGVLINPKRKA